MSTNSNRDREVRGPDHDARQTRGLEATLRRTAAGRAFAKSDAGRRAIARDRARRGLDFGGASQAPTTPAPATRSQDGGRPVAFLRDESAVSDVRVNERSPYGPNSTVGYFADKVRLAEADAANDRWIAGAQRHLVGTDPGLPAYGQGTLDDARRRIMLGEKRDVTSAGGGAGFTTVAWFGQSFDNAARAVGRIRDLVTVRDLPLKGMTVRVPRLTTGTTTAVQAGEDTSVSESDPVSVAVDGGVVTLTGMVDVSRQLLERSGGLADEAIGRDLAEDLARVLDQQVIDGSGASGQITGLLQTSGITSTTYTDASPTVAEWRAQVWKNYRDVVSAAGLEPDVLAWHQTRAAWAWSGTDTVERQMVGIDLPVAQTVVGAVPTTKGTGTNEDRTLIWNRESVHLFLSPVTFTVDPDLGSGTGTVRILARMYASLIVRRPEAVGVLTGTGTVVPTL